MFPGEKEFLERLVKDVTKLIEEDLQTLPEFYHEYYRHVMEPLLNRMFSSASIKRSPLSEDDSRNSEQSLLRCYEAMIKCR